MKIISTIKQWHKENRQYDGFFEFECFSCLTLFLFAGNICIHNTTAVDWLIWVIWLQSTLFQAYKWLHNRSQKEILDFVKDRCKEMIDELIEEKYTQRNRLVAANRRRQSAERRFKKCIKELSCERIDKRKHAMLADRHHAMLIVAYKAIMEGNEEARQTFAEYMYHVSSGEIAEVKARSIILDDLLKPFQQAVQSLALFGEMVKFTETFAPGFLKHKDLEYELRGDNDHKS